MFTSLLNASPLATLPTPDEMLKARPCPARLARQIARSRQQARHILQGEDDRLLLVIGPCSIHDPVAARDGVFAPAFTQRPVLGQPREGLVHGAGGEPEIGGAASGPADPGSSCNW